MVADIARHVKPVVQVEYLGIGLAALCQIHAGGGLEVRNHVLALVGGYILVNYPQFAFNDGQALIDEYGGAYCYLVLVLDPFLVIYSYQRIQNIFSPLNGTVLYRQVDYRCLIFGQGYGQP